MQLFGTIHNEPHVNAKSQAHMGVCLNPVSTDVVLDFGLVQSLFWALFRALFRALVWALFRGFGSAFLKRCTQNKLQNSS